MGVRLACVELGPVCPVHNVRSFQSMACGMTLIDPQSVPVLHTDGHLPALARGQCQPEALRRRFASPLVWTPEIVSEPPLGLREPVDAAVLIAIVLREEPAVLLTQRSAQLATHAGQIAFPGGRVDATDGSVVAAALREAHEEVGLPPSHVDILGCLPQYLTGTHYAVTPVVALVPPDWPYVPSPHEVTDVFEVPLAFLMNPANHHWHEAEYRGARRRWLSMPYQDGPSQRYIWGATAGMLRNLYGFLRLP